MKLTPMMTIFFILENSPRFYNNSQDLDFYIARGVINFTLHLMVHDFTYANDVHRGSFLQNFDFGNSYWIVFHNPSSTQTLSVEYKLSFRSTIFWLIIIFLFCSALCCVCWIHAKSNIHVQKRIRRETKKLYPGISYDTHVFRKTKRRSDISLFVPPQGTLENSFEDPMPIPAPMSTPLLAVGSMVSSPNSTPPFMPVLTPVTTMSQFPIQDFGIEGISGISSGVGQKMTGISSSRF